MGLREEIWGQFELGRLENGHELQSVQVLREVPPRRGFAWGGRWHC